jgi:hypothetical protein
MDSILVGVHKYQTRVTITNTDKDITYSGEVLITALKSFIVQVPSAQISAQTSFITVAV